MSRCAEHRDVRKAHHERYSARRMSRCAKFSFINLAKSVENEIRSEPMKVDSVALPGVSNAQMNDLPIMNAEEIKSILYLGIKGEIKLDPGTKHAVDTYA